MYTVEVTAPSANGLDYLIKDGSLKPVAWAYTENDAEKIADSLNEKKDRDIMHDHGSSVVDPVPPKCDSFY